MFFSCLFSVLVFAGGYMKIICLCFVIACVAYSASFGVVHSNEGRFKICLPLHLIEH